jgi:hypothetical protein
LAARNVSSTATLTAWNWWYPAIFFARAPGVFEPRRFLDLVRHFIVFENLGA